MELGPLEILVILAVVVMIFGVGKLPEVGSALGKGIREFRTATHEDDSTPKVEDSQPEPPPEGLNCAVCGAPNTATVRFCTNCGRPMASVAGAAESMPEPSAGVSCAVCGAANEPTVRFCTNCGRPMAGSLQPEGVNCVACGASNAATIRFCTSCGRPMAPVAGA